MFMPGQKVKYLEKDVVVLVENKDKVLICLSDKWIKWVDKKFISISESGYELTSEAKHHTF